MMPTVARCHLGLARWYRLSEENARAYEHLATSATMFRRMDMRDSLQRTEALMHERAGIA
jgi:ferric-dicitrate binding protein FerR (iron transport regulator)